MTWLNWPNRVTLARVVLLPPFVISLLNLRADWPGWRYVALGIFLLMGLSDVLDGYLARRLNQITTLGKALDPLADKLLVTFSLIFLSIESTSVPGFVLPSWVPVVAIGKDLIIGVGYWIIFFVIGESFIQPRPLGKLCTLLQLVAVGFALAGPDMPSVLHVGFPILYWTASVVAVAALIDYVRLGNAFASRSVV